MSHLLSILKVIFTNEKNQGIIEKNKDVLTKLKFIGTIQIGEKIDVKNLRVENNTIFTPFKRAFFGDSRDQLLTFISSVLERSYEIIDLFIQSEKISEKVICKNVVSDLIKAIQGLKNVQKTYKDDKLFYCNIDMVVENIEAKILELKSKNEELFILDNIAELIHDKEDIEEIKIELKSDKEETKSEINKVKKK